MAGTRGQSEEADNKLYARARLIWADSFTAPRLRNTITSRKPEATKRATARNLHGHTEAALRRRRETDLRKLRQTRPSTAARAASSVAAAARLWGPAQDKELKRQGRLRTERLLDAADMGVATVDPEDLWRYKAKAKKPTIGTLGTLEGTTNLQKPDPEGHSKSNLACQHG